VPIVTDNAGVWDMPPHRFSLRQLPLTVGIGFAVLAAMVATSAALAVYLSRQTVHTSAVSSYRRAITDVLSAARDAEIGQRGFLLTNGNEAYLEPYNAAAGDLDAAVDRVAQVLPVRGTRIASEMRPIVAAKLRELQATIDLQRGGQRATALEILGSNRGKLNMDRLRAIGERERRWAIAETDDRLARSRMALQLLVAGLLAGALVVVALSLMWMSATRRQLLATERARSDAEAALAALRTENAARETAESQVRQLQKMESLGQLTGGIAHDFNNMLAVVMGGIELAKKRLRSDPDRADKMLDNAREGATRAAKLTARLLAFSRNQPLAPAPLDLNKLLGGMCDMLSRTLGDTVDVQCIYAAGLWRCYADPGEVENAILNLAVNARDAMPDGGKLTVETANAYVDDVYARERRDVTAGQYVLICVSDTGTGMPQDVIDRAFEPFFTTKAVGKGTGLGLSQVFGFSKQSGGHVAIYSESGQGTTIKLYLPRFIGNDGVVTPAREDYVAMPAGKPAEVILVVEDEQRVRHFAVDALRELGYTSISAPTPGEALIALEQQPEITMLFTDIVMPEMTGRELADAALEMRPDLKVLFTTGYTRNAVVHNGVIDIGVAFLAKPYGMRDLACKVRDVLDGGGVNRPV